MPTNVPHLHMAMTASPQSPEPPYSPYTDDEIVDRVLAGDVGLFEILMRRNNTRVFRAIRSILRSDAEIEDAMQSAYVLAFTKLRSFQRTASFRTWLTQIALNEALGRVRSARRHPSIGLSLMEEPMVSAAAVVPESPEGHADRKQLGSLLEQAIDALPENYRVVFMLREIDELDTAETAWALGVTEDVIKTRLSRARAMLRDKLEALVGSAEAFGFHATRCDRVVAGVMAEIARTEAR